MYSCIVCWIPAIVEENKYGFTGFLNSGAAAYSQEDRKEFVIRQLGDLLGDELISPISYSDKIWTDEYILAGNQIIQRPHQNNGLPLFQKSYYGYERLQKCT